MSNTGYVYLGQGDYYYRNGHFYRKWGNRYRKLHAMQRYNKVRVSVSISGKRRTLSFINPKASSARVHFFDILNDYEYRLWKSKLDTLKPSAWPRFNDCALWKYLQASVILNKNAGRRKKFFERLFKL